MGKKKDSEEEQKEKLIAEIIKVKFGIGMSQPTEKMTTLEREDHERLSMAAYPSNQKNAFVERVESLIARLREKSLKEVSTILEEELKKKADGRSSKTINELVSKIQAKVNDEYNDKQQATIEDENECQQNNTHVGTRKKGSYKYSPRDDLGRLMLRLAETFAKGRNGAIINGDELLSLLKKNGATVKRSDKKYVKYTDEVIKEVILVSKDAFERRLTRIRKYVEENPHT